MTASRTCPYCHRETGDGPRCQQCGEVIYRFAIDDYPDSTQDRQAPVPDPPRPAPIGAPPVPADPFAPDNAGMSPYDAPVAPSTGAGPKLAVPPATPPTAERARAARGPNGCAIAAMILGGVVVLSLVVLVFVGRSMLDEAGTFLDQGFTGSAGQVVDWSQVEVGDCINLVDQVDQGDNRLVSTLERVDCFDEHDAEVFALFDLTDGAWPGTDEAYGEGDNGCYDRFEGYVGIDYMDSYYFYEVYTPTADTWEAGDRTVACTLVDPGGSIAKPLHNSGE